MTLKERIEKNPIIYLITTSAAVSAVVFGVVAFLCAQRIELADRQHKLELSTIETRLTSIRRSLGKDGSLDVRSFVHPMNQKSEVQVPNTSKYFDDDGFYASADDSHWTYEKTTEAGLYQLYEESPPPAIVSLTAKTSVHLWRAKEELPIDGYSGRTKLFASAFVEKVQIADFANSMHLGVALAQARGTAHFEKNEANEFVRELDQMFRGDVAGTLLSIHMQAAFREQLESPATSTELVELTKIGNVVYAQWLTTLKDVVVSGHKYSEYFIREEIVLITDSEDIYIIATAVPSADPAPRTQTDRWMNEWFSDLAIFVR